MYGISIFIPLVSLASRMVDFLRFLFLLVVFFVRIWLAYALFLFTLPVPVRLKRFAAPLWVFIFGITSLLIYNELKYHF